MLKVLLICSMGASTAVLCEKIKAAAKEENVDLEIWATALSMSGDEIGKADLILLGPQVRYMKNKVSKEADGKPVEAIDMQTYGKLDGKKVFELIKEMRERI